LRWADQNHQEIVEILKEKNKAYSSSENNGEINLFNIIIRKKEE
jgi:hypothetical protein